MYTERHDDRYGGRYIKETKNSTGYLENDPFFDWQPMKCFEQWSDVFMSAFAKSDFRSVVLSVLQPYI